MHRILVFAVLVFTICCLLAGSVAADRLILIPEGTTLTTGQVKGEVAIGTEDDSPTVIWGNVGISRLEVEGAWFSNFGPENVQAYGVQVSVLPETSFTPALAVGVRDIGDEASPFNSLYNGRSFYAALSKGIPFSDGIPFLQDVKFHGGVGTGSLSGVFFGAEAAIPGGIHLAGEYDTEDFNFSAAYGFARIAQLKVYSIRSDFYFGASLSTAF